MKTKVAIATINISLTLGPLGSVVAEPGGDHRRDGHDGHDALGAVYTMDNSPGGNQVWALSRHADGSLAEPKLYATHGTGTGSGLGNQGGVLLSRDGRWLFTCNASSDNISVFAVTPRGLILTDLAPAQGKTPISLTLHRNLLYVLNAGEPNSIAGYLFAHGHLVPLPGAVHELSAANTGPAQVAFTSDGDHLVVTEKGTGLIDVFTLGGDGTVDDLKSFVSPAPPPFGFAAGFRDRIFVTQAAGGGANPGASSVSSYAVTDDGDLEVISDSVATTQTAACWLILTRNERFAFTANTPNDSLSSFRVNRDGELTLVAAQAANTGAGSGPVDMALSRDNRFLYSLNAANGTIGTFRLNDHTGALAPMNGARTVPRTANGLAAQ